MIWICIVPMSSYLSSLHQARACQPACLCTFNFMMPLAVLANRRLPRIPSLVRPHQAGNHF
jgi:hypothetical protein